MAQTYYTESHEYLRVEGETATVGVTDHAQDQLGDIVYVELPQRGETVEQGAEIGVVESVKSASELYSPVSGEVTETNDALADAPEQVNNDPLGEGWLFKIKLSKTRELDQLMGEDAYKRFIEEA